MAEQTTFAEAIKAGRDVFERARASLGSLPCASDAAEKPATVEGVLKAQEERLAGLSPEAKAPKSKSKPGKDREAPTETHPGYRIGVTSYKYPFWALVEVRVMSGS